MRLIENQTKSANGLICTDSDTKIVKGKLYQNPTKFGTVGINCYAKNTTLCNNNNGFSITYMVNRNTLPRFLILNTKDIIDYLRFKINPLLKWDENKYLSSKINNIMELNEDRLMPMVIDVIHKEKDAELELQYAGMDIICECIGDVYEEDIDTLVDTLIKVGTYIVLELKRIGAYKDGILTYRYDHMLNRDIVLIRD